MSDDKRPYCRATRFIWNAKDGTKLDGIAIIGAPGPVAAHMDPAQARSLADSLHDLAAKLEAGEPAACPRCGKPTSRRNCEHCNADTCRAFTKMEKGTANVR